ncbi:MAG: putative phage baseplate assembly protein, partial [Myxococcota bacterium]
FWVRARLEMGGYDEPPVCDRILLNSVYASNYTTYPETVLGSSQGTPNQSWYFNRGPVLPGQSLCVVEHERPAPPELEKLVAEEGDDAFVTLPDGDGFLVRWHQVESLYESDSHSRHYVKDITTGQVRFGDGVHGMIPPKGDRNVRAVTYRVGGGSGGNVPAGSIEVLKRSLSYVDTVSNPFGAMGGADLESVDEIKLRGPAMLKSRGRAVTREDFEALAIQASNSVARVNCIAGYRGEGQVGVVVVPKVAEGHADFMSKPVPTTELVRRVARYLDERKLITTRLHVIKPRYRELSVKVEIMRQSSGSADRIKREITERLHYFLHPLKGGKDGRGWPFGRNVFKVDLYHVVEEVEGVDFVSRIRIHDEDKKVDAEQIRVLEDELPFLVNVEIGEKAHEKIV